MGKVLDLNANLILLGKWPRSSPVVGRVFASFSSFVCSIAGLQRSTVKLHIVGTASFLNASRQGFKLELLTVRFCSKLFSVESYVQTRQCFKGVQHSLFISIRHSLLSFGSWVNLEVLTFDFELLCS